MKKILLFLTVLFIISISAFSQALPEVSQTDTLRVVSLAPNITEIIYALDAQDCLVGRSDYCNYPEEVLQIECAGNVWQPNIEVLVALQPDVVLAASLLDPSYAEAIEKAGIKLVHIVSEETIEGTYELISQVGKAIKHEIEAEKLIDTIKDEFEQIAKKVTEIKDRKTCVYLLGWGQFGDFAATGDTFINDLIDLAGGINIAQQTIGWSISQELLISENPDLIILPSYSYAPADIEGFKSTEPYSKLTGRIITIDGDIADRQGVRSSQFCELVAKELYPEVFK